MSPSGAIGEIALTFPGNQERTLTTISSQLHIIKAPKCLPSVAGRDVDVMTVSAPGGPQPLTLHGPPCQMSSSTPDAAILLATTEGELNVGSHNTNNVGQHVTVLQCYNVTMLQCCKASCSAVLLTLTQTNLML